MSFSFVEKTTFCRLSMIVSSAKWKA